MFHMNNIYFALAAYGTRYKQSSGGANSHDRRGVVQTKGAILSINEGIQEINGRRHGQVAGTTANFNFKLS